MSWSPAPPLEAFAEAISVPAMIHTPPRETKVLVVGAYALPMAKLALRYPSTTEVIIVGDRSIPVPRDRRVSRIDSLKDLAADWRADVAAVAVPGDPTPQLLAIRAALRPDGILVTALDTFSRGRDVKEALQKHWKQVIPYREYAPEPVLFMLASDRRLAKPLRPIPTNLARITIRYIPAMFSLAKDENALLYGETA